jgi:hypothetical protein
MALLTEGEEICPEGRKQFRVVTGWGANREGGDVYGHLLLAQSARQGTTLVH